LIQEIFGAWAILVDNSVPAIVDAIEELNQRDLDLSHYRIAWNKLVDNEIEKMLDFLRSNKK
jgi:hypothetical protein